MAAAQAAENHVDEWGLTWYFLWGICKSIPTWTHSQSSQVEAEAPTLNTSPNEHLSNDHEEHPNQPENSHKLCDETGHPVVNFMESQQKPRQQHCTVEQILASEEINKSKRAGLWVWDLSRKVNHLSMVIWDRKIIAEFTRSISSTRIDKPVLMMNVKVSKNKNSRWVDQENLIYVRWNRIKNRAQRRKRWSIVEKEVRHWVK